MLNIDYSSPRKFLMSLGLTLIFSGYIIVFLSGIFSVEQIRNTDNFLSTTKNVNEVNYVYTKDKLILDGAGSAGKVGFLSVSAGILLLSIGTIIWIKTKK
jgi:hypothetical protein